MRGIKILYKIKETKAFVFFCFVLYYFMYSSYPCFFIKSE